MRGPRIWPEPYEFRSEFGSRKKVQTITPFLQDLLFAAKSFIYIARITSYRIVSYHTSVCDKNTPPEKMTLERMSLQSIKSGGGEQVLPLDCRAKAHPTFRAKARPKIEFFHRYRYHSRNCFTILSFTVFRTIQCNISGSLGHFQDFQNRS